MKYIVVEQERFDALFQRALDKLKLDQFTDSSTARSREQIFATDNMHRKFHYEVCCLKSELEKS
jgi:hypothetical protein